MKTTNLIQEIMEAFDVSKEADEIVYHNARLLLKLYSDVIWRLEADLDEFEQESRQLVGEDLLTAIEALTDFDYRFNKERVERRLRSIENSKSIVELVGKALILLKNHPQNGEIYFNILNKVYIIKYKYSEYEVLDALNISRTTYYKYKKSAINLLGVILWGFVLPKAVQEQNVVNMNFQRTFGVQNAN